MALIGSHEEKQTPFLKEYAADNPQCEGESYKIEKIFDGRNGCLITLKNDEFITFVFKGSSLYKSVINYAEKSSEDPFHVEALYIQVDDGPAGDYSIIASDNEEMCLVGKEETNSGKTYYYFQHHCTKGSAAKKDSVRKTALEKQKT